MNKFNINLISNEQIWTLNIKILNLESEKSSQETIFKLEQLKIEGEIKELKKQLLSFESECAKSKEGHLFLFEEAASEESDLTVKRCQKCGAWSR